MPLDVLLVNVGALILAGFIGWYFRVIGRR